MGKIQVLEKNVAELIAAGEVIERPASIVKELLENTIDAGATAVTIEIRRGGISYIRITDNGCGMDKEDLPTAFLRHATSKIKESDDLENITTLGFRGEALASIAAVSRVKITSKTTQSDYGNTLILEGGEIMSCEECGCPDGTTIIVKDLFFNVPARLKFLKKDISEANVISAMIDKLALSHPEISFKFINEHKVKLHTPGNGDLLSAIHAVFGKDFSASVMPVSYEYNGVKVNGFTSKTNASRSNRSMQHFFVNSRYVRSKTCMAALEEGYKNSIMIGKFPFCVLDVSVPFNAVDVNVHPAKIEVRFVNERMVFDAIYFAVKSAINDNDALTHAVMPIKKSVDPMLAAAFRNEETTQTGFSSDNSMPISYVQKAKEETNEPIVLNSKPTNYQVKPLTVACGVEKPVSKEALQSTLQNAITEEFQYINAEKLITPQVEKRPLIKLEEPVKESSITQQELMDQTVENTKILPEVIEKLPVRFIGEIFKTYVLFESGDHFMMMDKHAAHERVLYENLKQSIKSDQRQMLLNPIILSFSADEFNAVIEQQPLLLDMGFLFEEFGNNTIAIREVPLILAQYDIQDVFSDIARKLQENKRDISSDIFENLLHSIACRSAIKANDINSEKELISLIETVLSNDKIRYCPHGRPVVNIMKKSEIEKKFGRI